MIKNKFKLNVSNIVESKIVEKDGKKVKQSTVRFYKFGISKNGTNFTKDSSDSFKSVLEKSPVMFVNHNDWEPFNRDVEDAVSYYVPDSFEVRVDGVYGKVEFYESDLSAEVFDKVSKTPDNIGLSVHGYAEVDEQEDETGGIIRTVIVWQALASVDWVVNPAAAGKLVQESWKMSKNVNNKENSEEDLMDVKELLESLKGLNDDNRGMVKEMLENRDNKINEMAEELKTLTETSKETETKLKTELDSAKEEVNKLKESVDTLTNEKEELQAKFKNIEDEAAYSKLVAEAKLPEKIEEMVSNKEGWFYKEFFGKDQKLIVEAFKDLGANITIQESNGANNEGHTNSNENSGYTEEEILSSFEV